MGIKISISAKASDMGSYEAHEGDKLIWSHLGYVPDLLEAVGSGDYIELEIDNDTGMIKGWKPVDFTEKDEEDDL